MMISLARAGPTRRTKRVVEATPSGTPRSTSGIQNSASVAAQRKSHASVSPQPPPIACPLIIAIVGCSRFSSSVFARSKRRRNWLFRCANARRRSSGVIFELSGASAPAEKTGGAPVTITTRVAASSRSSPNAAPSSVSIASLSELRRSGRFSVSPHDGLERRQHAGRDNRGDRVGGVVEAVDEVEDERDEDDEDDGGQHGRSSDRLTPS